MVHVRLEKEWTDGKGISHAPGDSVDVDAATLAKLQAAGIVGGETDWLGPTGEGTEKEDWLGPTGTKP